MTISPPVVEQTGRRAVARRRFPRRWGQFDEPRLEFVGPDTAVLDEPEAELELEPRADPEPALEVESSAETQPTADTEEPEPDTVADTGPVAKPTRLTPGPRPPAANLLKPRGRLLSRAFDLTGDQHSVLTGASGVALPPDDPPPPDADACGAGDAEAG